MERIALMIRTNETHAMAFVAFVEIPEFKTRPADIVIWGSRLFVNDGVRRHDGSRVYVEGAAVTSFTTSPGLPVS